LIGRIKINPSIISAIAFSVAYAVVEYYWIRDPTFGLDPVLFTLLYPYHFIMALIFGLATYVILSADLRQKTIFSRLMLIGGLLSLMLVVEDFAWFTFRAIAPVNGDANGGRWILKGEWTTKFMGSTDAYFTAIPNWYFLSIAFCAASFKLIRGKQPWLAIRPLT
jgi:hypothetical protein